MRQFFLVSILLAFAQFTSADDLVIMPGPAFYKCTQWSESETGELRTPLAMWLFGFVSGSNFRSIQNSTQAKVLDNEAALTFADQYCRENPNHALSQLALAVVEQFGGPKIKQK